MSASPVTGPETGHTGAPPVTTSSTTTVSSMALSDQLPGSIPKLDPTGVNWAIFSVRFQDAIEAKGFWGHFDDSEPCPVAVNQELPTDTEKSRISQWKKNKRSAKSLLMQKLPDSSLMHIHTKKMVQEWWNAIKTKYTEKGAFAQTELRAKFLGMKCPEKG